MTDRRDCPVKSCSRHRKTGHLMCCSHWRRVPHILQRAVWDTFSRYRRLSSEPRWQLSLKKQAEVHEAEAHYNKAVADAIAAVEAKEIADA